MALAGHPRPCETRPYLVSTAKNIPATIFRAYIPEGCRGRLRYSQTAPATRRGCVDYHGTETRLKQVNLEKIELEELPFKLEKKGQKPSLRLQPCEIANISPRAENCNIAWLESADSMLAEQVPVQRPRVHVRSQNLALFARRSDWSVPWLHLRDIW